MHKKRFKHLGNQSHRLQKGKHCLEEQHFLSYEGSNSLSLINQDNNVLVLPFPETGSHSAGNSYFKM